MSLMRILIIEVSEGRTVLAGYPNGTLFLSKLIQIAERHPEPMPIFLDFKGIEVVTGSFLNSGILGFRDYCKNSNINLIPIVANANTDILDELMLVLEKRGDAVVICDLDDKGKTKNARVLGILEEKQAIALEAVVKEKETDAVTLEKRHRSTDKIGATGWNNRLSALAAKGILIETKKGRTKTYRPVLELR